MSQTNHAARDPQPLSTTFEIHNACLSGCNRFASRSGSCFVTTLCEKLAFKTLCFSSHPDAGLKAERSESPKAQRQQREN